MELIELELVLELLWEPSWEQAPSEVIVTRVHACTHGDRVGHRAQRYRVSQSVGLWSAPCSS